MKKQSLGCHPLFAKRWFSEDVIVMCVRWYATVPTELPNEAERAAAAEVQRVAALNARNNATPGEALPYSGRATSNPASPNQTGPLSASDLKLAGGPNADILRSLYLGEFDKVSQDRSSTAFSAITSGYIEGFFQACRRFIQDPVDVMESVCDSEWVNGYGVRTGCAHYTTRPSGIIAERALYAAVNSTPTQQMGSGLRTVLDAMAGHDPISGAMNMAANVIQLKSEAQNLVLANGCTTPALTRFKENLQRFALGKEGMRLDGTVRMGVAMLPPAAGETYRDSDYSKLLGDMVNVQSKTWAINRYIPGSIRAVNVTSRDSSGRPARVSASYETVRTGGTKKQEAT